MHIFEVKLFFGIGFLDDSRDIYKNDILKMFLKSIPRFWKGFFFNN